MMARSAKTRTDKPTLTEDVVAGDLSQGPQDVPVAETVPTQEVVTDLTADIAREPEVGAELADSVLIVDPDPVPLPNDPDPVVETPPIIPPTESARPDRPAPPPAQVTVQKVGFVPLALGGVVAAGLGFLAAWQGFGMGPATDGTAIAAQADRIAALEAQIAALPTPEPATDIGPVTADLAALRTDLTGQIAPLADQMQTLDTRLTALENTPAADGTLSSTAIANWQAELDTLRTDIAAQESRMQAMAAEASSRLDAAQSTVAEIEQTATASATAVLQRAAITRMQAALDAGTAFDAALGELAATGVAVPDALTAVAVDGVPTVGALGDSFPVAARAALATARAEGLADDGANGMFAFLRSQLDVRSVTPREGTDPDAILSRAEAALGEGRLSDALAEIDALPEVVRAEMSGWVTLAESRIAAIAALQGLSESLPSSSN